LAEAPFLSEDVYILRASIVISALASVVTTALMLYVMARDPIHPHELADPFFWLYTLAWPSSPYLALAILALLFRNSLSASSVILVGIFILASLGVFGMCTSLLGADFDAQSGLVLLVVPFLQWLGVGGAALTAVLAVLISHIESR
jgi:hypothetical protein